MRNLYIPENLFLESMVPDYLNNNLHLDHMEYIINLIYEQKVLYKNKEDFVNLKAIYLRNIIRNYKVYINWLIDKNIIECDNFYIKTEKSYGFKLMENYSKVKHRKKLIRTSKFSKKLLLY